MMRLSRAYSGVRTLHSAMSSTNSSSVYGLILTPIEPLHQLGFTHQRVGINLQFIGAQAGITPQPLIIDQIAVGCRAQQIRHPMQLNLEPGGPQ